MGLASILNREVVSEAIPEASYSYRPALVA
jgi:hypothetical protein